MIPLIKHYFFAFFLDEQFAKRVALVVLGFLVSVLATVAAFGVQTILLWSTRERVAHLIVAAIGGLVALLPTPKIAPPPGAPQP